MGEITYVKAYVELTRLVVEYEKLVNSTKCKDVVDETCDEKERPYYVELNKLTLSLTEMTEKVVDVKGRIQLGMRAETKLRAHIKILTHECQGLGATESALDKVRDVIHVLGSCPGLSRPKFHIPLWVGKWYQGLLDTTTYDTDEQIDAALTKLCQ